MKLYLSVVLGKIGSWSLRYSAAEKIARQFIAGRFDSLLRGERVRIHPAQPFLPD
ncbi:Uncharacterized protein dnm_000560 [Desulfonema magnum]|uniref:Uncharacterized protein n=1 Tax=Desulfonema magnum TaxID=45655 RepID=A0A975BE76_9BACT|nr:Uncharacterized protein dnm_000560 [Desulfonema magnum]